jgi:hypothetical protein
MRTASVLHRLRQVRRRPLEHLHQEVPEVFDLTIEIVIGRVGEHRGEFEDREHPVHAYAACLILIDAALATQPITPTPTDPERRRQFRVIQGGRD